MELVDAGIGFFALIVLALIGMLVVGGIVAVVALLANPKTRAAGTAVLAIGLLVLVVGGLMVFGLRSFRRHVAVREGAHVQRAQIEAFRPQRPTSSSRAEEHRRRAAEMEKHELEAGNDGRIPLSAAEEAPAEEPLPEPEEPAEEPSTGTDGPSAEEQSPGEETSSEEAKPSTAEERPQWVDKLPASTGDVYQMAVKTDPRPTRAECESKLRTALNEAISAYARTELKRDPQVARQVQLPLTYVQRNIVKEKWPESGLLKPPLDKWIRLHALLQVDQEAKKQIEKECEQVQCRLEQQRYEASVMRRLWYSGTGLGAVLAVLAVLFACLKIDQATERPCRGRLTLAAIGALLVIAAAAFLAVGFIEAPPEAVHSVDLTPAGSVDPAPAEHVDPASSPTKVTRVDAAAWVVLLPILLLLLGGIVALGALLASPKSRAAGLVVLTLVLLGGLAAGLSAAHFRVSIGPVELIVVAVATVYILLLTVLSRNRWAWVLGIIACFVIAAAFTPADPASMLLVVLPLCVMYTVAVFARKSPRKTTGEETPPQGRTDVEARQP